MKNVWIVVFLMMLTLFGCVQSEPPFECTDALGCVDIAPDEPIKIAVLQAGGPGLGPQLAQTVEYAVNLKENMILDHPIELINIDTGCTSEGGSNAALRLAADPTIIAILGPTCDSATTPVLDTLNEQNLSMLTATVSSFIFTSNGDEPGTLYTPGFYRFGPNNAFVGSALSGFAEEQGKTRLAILTDEGLGSQEIADIVEAAWVEAGLELAGRFEFTRGDENFAPILEAVAFSEPDILLFSTTPTDIVTIIPQIAGIEDLEDTLLVGISGHLNDRTFATANAINRDMAFVSQYTYNSSPEALASFGAFAQAYEGIFLPIVGYLPMFDATNALVDTIAEVAVAEDDGTLHVGRQALRDALNSTEYTGLGATYTCNEFGDCFQGTTDVYLLENQAEDMASVLSNVAFSYDPGASE